MEGQNAKQIVIVGGGFGGIACALRLCRKMPKDFKIYVVSDKPCHEFTPSLHNVITGRFEREACIPLAEIFHKKSVEIVHDKITGVNLNAHTVYGSSGKEYGYDYLVLALGSETAYFPIPGLKEFSFGLKSIRDALRLKKHIYEMFKRCTEKSDDAEEDVCRLHFVVVGGGTSGVSVAGAISDHAKLLAQKYKIDPSFVTVELIEAASRILPTMPVVVSEKISQRLRALGVNVFTNRPMTSEEAQEISLRGVTFRADTVIWTAGVRPNDLYGKIKEFFFDRYGRVEVDEHLRPRGQERVFVIGDGASTSYAGLAQTAIWDGKSAAENIAAVIRGKPLKKYQPQKPATVIAIGSRWAAVSLGPVRLYGVLGWLIRRAADLKYFLSVLPSRKAFKIFCGRGDLCLGCVTYKADQEFQQKFN